MKQLKVVKDNYRGKVLYFFRDGSQNFAQSVRAQLFLLFHISSPKARNLNGLTPVSELCFCTSIKYVA